MKVFAAKIRHHAFCSVKCSNLQKFGTVFAVIICCGGSHLIQLPSVKAGDFEPYANNGGLVSAVAGRDFVVLATDTRLGGEGYNIAHRQHVSSRLWTTTSRDSQPEVSAPDGSLVVDWSSTSKSDDSKGEEPLTLLTKATYSPPLAHQPHVWIGSVGCLADCEDLKRSLRSKLRAASYFGECNLSPDQVSVALSQTLYNTNLQRNGLCYYSFCVVAGLSAISGGGEVYVYDPIGSYEQVAAACSGTGRSMLQPILDQAFGSGRRPAAVSSSSRHIHKHANHIPVPHVNCSSPVEVVNVLLDGYRAVSEREIGVGDHVVFHSVQRRADGTVDCQTWTAPLKKH